MTGAESRVVAAGKSLEYRLWGEGAPGPTIVLLHEGLGCVALWKGFPEALHTATGLAVLAYSRAGYGMSDADDLPRDLDWMTREAEAVLPEVLAALGLRAPLLVGHSDGATIAAIHAGRIGNVAGVVLMAPHFFTEDMGLAEIARARQVFAETDLRDRMAKYHRDPGATFRGWADAWLAPGFRAWNVEEVLAGITCPVLAIQGRQDQYGTLAQIEAVTARVKSPVEALILDDCGHAPHLEQPEQVVRAIVSFVHNIAKV